MKINWFTVIAQVFNFLILVWLLKKFLYKPVLDAIDTREKKIASRLEDAKSKEEEAKKNQDTFTEKNKQFDAQKKEMMDKAISDTNVEKTRLMEDARKEVDDLHTKQQKALEDAQENIKMELAQKIQEQVFDIARKALTELASADLEEQATKLFIGRLSGLKPEEKKKFTDAFSSGNGSVSIQSAFALRTEQKADIKKAVNEILGNETGIEFKIVPQIISGIELSANGYKLSWSISAYLDSLQKDIFEMVKDNTESPLEAGKVDNKIQEPVKKAAQETN